MIKYVLFIIRISFKKFKFFYLSTDQKIHILKQNKLFFQAGLLYKKQGNYTRAIGCFEQVNAYSQLIDCYEHLNDFSNALILCHKHKLYKLGAKIASTHSLDLQAAYFYSFFDLPQAIKYYKVHNLYYELGTCYLKQYRFYLAYDTFCKCRDTLQKFQGIKLIEEVAITLYLSHEYEEALKLFIHIQDYLSALECAKSLHNDSLIADISHSLATYYIQEDLPEAANFFLWTHF